MATMFPEEPISFHTNGEEDVFRFFQRCAKPDSECLCWYAPRFGGIEADFLLYTPWSGLIIFEVKDWTMDQIWIANQETVTIQVGKDMAVRENPMRQALGYRNILLELLKKSKIFDRQINGKLDLTFPIATGVIFPHATRESLLRSPLVPVLEDGRCITWDEISQFSDDPSGQKLRAWMLDKKHFWPLFRVHTRPQDLRTLRAILYPENEIHHEREHQDAQEEVVRVLDVEQENTARSIKSGRHLIAGPSGCGKTLMLAVVAANLARRHVKRILVTHFNLSLRGYLRRLLADKRVPLGKDLALVTPFYELCRTELGVEVTHSGEDGDYYAIVREDARRKLERNPDLRERWEAILVDEGQDFGPDMAEILRLLLKPGGTLVVARDENQNVYGNEQAWESATIDIPTQNRHYLHRVYRNTKAIARAATRLLPEGSATGKEEFRGTPGDQPSPDLCEDMNTLAARVAWLVEQQVSEKGGPIPMNEIAVLTLCAHAADGRDALDVIAEEIERLGLLTRRVTRDEHSKLNFDITTDSIALSSVHSAKGMDFRVVILLGLDQLSDCPADRRLAYVGFTRARERLFLPVLSRGGLVPLLDR